MSRAFFETKNRGIVVIIRVNGLLACLPLCDLLARRRHYAFNHGLWYPYPLSLAIAKAWAIGESRSPWWATCAYLHHKWL